MNRLSKKSEFIKIRVTSEEKQKIVDNAQLAKMSISKYLITLVYRKRMVVITDANQLIADIHGACVNLNQIARVANSQKFVNKNNVEAILKLSTELKKLLYEIIDLIVEQDKDNYVTQPTVTNVRLGNVETTLFEISQSIKEIQNKIGIENGSS